MLVHQTDHLTLSSIGETLVLPPPPPIVKSEERYVKSKCLAGNGEAYTGDLSVSMGGRTCMQWSAPEVPALIKGKEFLPQVQLVKNHCRNPDGDMEGGERVAPHSHTLLRCSHSWYWSEYVLYVFDFSYSEF